MSAKNHASQLLYRINHLLVYLIKQILHAYKKAHYHEYPIYNDSGEIIGFEVITSSGTYLVYKNVEKSIDSESNSAAESE